MVLRLVEVIVPSSTKGRVEELLKGQHADILPTIELGEGRTLWRFILEAEEAEEIIDHLTSAFSTADCFRLNILPLQATIPDHKPKEEAKDGKEGEEGAKTPPERPTAPTQPKEPSPEIQKPVASESKDSTATKEPPPPPKRKEEPNRGKGEKGPKKTPPRISVEELYNSMGDSVRLNLPYLALIALSVCVAAVGLVQNNVAVIIGAMVIAPLLSPNMALSLATTLANRKLANKALKVLGAGILLALVVSFMLGIFVDVDPTLPEIQSRTSVSLGDIAVALAAGAAAAIFIGLGVNAALVGVTVAVALLPPLVVTGLLAGAGQLELAINSFLLLVCNIIGVNLAGTLVFVAEGVWPRSWWEERKAKRTAIIAISIWAILLGILILLLLITQNIISIPWSNPFSP